MILGIGTDIVQNSRVKKIIDRTGKRFIKRIFTEREISYCSEKKISYIHYAARFAAKEAVIKALSLKEYISWKNIEVENNSFGKPDIKLTGRAEEIFSTMNASRINISISHERQFSIAFVVIEG